MVLVWEGVLWLIFIAGVVVGSFLMAWFYEKKGEKEWD